MASTMNAEALIAKRQLRTRWAASWVGALALTASLWPAQIQARAAPESFADLAEQVTGAVVNISASTTVETRNRTLPQLPPGTPFEDLFEEFFNRRGQGGGGEQRQYAAASAARIPSAPALSSIRRASS